MPLEVLSLSPFQLLLATCNWPDFITNFNLPLIKSCVFFSNTLANPRGRAGGWSGISWAIITKGLIHAGAPVLE